MYITVTRSWHAETNELQRMILIVKHYYTRTFPMFRPVSNILNISAILSHSTSSLGILLPHHDITTSVFYLSWDSLFLASSSDRFLIIVFLTTLVLASWDPGVTATLQWLVLVCKVDAISVAALVTALR